MRTSYIIIVLSLCLKVSQTQTMSINWGKCEDQGTRDYMQDETLVKIPFGENTDALFGIFDGHGEGGEKVAQFLTSKFPEILYSYLIAKKDPKGSITATFKEIDKEILRKRNMDTSGSTALVALIFENDLHVAWAGDSRAILAQPKHGHLKLSWASTDHKPDLPEEKKRIEAAKGLIRDNQIFIKGGYISMSRSLGDKYFKQNSRYLAPLVIPDPEIHKIDLPENSYLIMASDGLWDFVTNDEAVNILDETIKQQKSFCLSISSLKNTQGNNPWLINAAKKLCDTALQNAKKKPLEKNESVSRDNISVLVVEFKKEKVNPIFYKIPSKKSAGLKEINEIVKKSVKKGIYRRSDIMKQQSNPKS